jgi:SAM-dependent methyltransferase
MAADPEFTGERFLPGLPGEIAYEHWHRYAFARGIVAGRRVLDAACGEGYGTALLADVAAEAIGVDIDAPTVERARSTYADRRRLRFETGSVTALPLADGAVDVVVSFETIEHLPAADQPRMLAEFARVLTPGGLLVLSSPNKRRYSDERGYANPFHLHELYRDDLARLLDTGFPARLWIHQVPLLASALWSESAASSAQAWMVDGRDVFPMRAPDGLYFLVVAAKAEGALPQDIPRLSVLVDAGDGELKRAEANAAEVLRLDGLLLQRDRTIAERDTALAAARREFAASEAARSALAVAHAETERDARHAIRALEAERQRLEGAIAAQERIIAYRQSARWWIQLPWLRLRLAWQRWVGR